MDVCGGTFIAYDLIDNGLYGYFFINIDGGLMELHQDASQYIDLNGRIRIDNGTMNIYGGSDDSYWPYAANAMIWMYGGTLDFKDRGVFINSSSYSLSEAIVGGTIRVNGGFNGNRSDFHPVGGTIELYGSNNGNLGHGDGSSFFNVLINKSLASGALQYSDNCHITNNLIVNHGYLDLNTYNLIVGNNVDINDGGTLSVLQPSTLYLTTGKNLNVNNGGRIEILGNETGMAAVRGNSASVTYLFNVFSGGTIAADYAAFSHLGPDGVNIFPGAIIDPADPFNHCSFQSGTTGGTFLTINNNQTLNIQHADFPLNMGYGSSNVKKTVDEGHIYFSDYTGAFAGETHDYDAYERIDWFHVMVGMDPGGTCQGNSAQLSAFASGGLPPYTYLWSPAESLSDPTLANPVASPLTTTTYTVTVTDSYGNSYDQSGTLTIYELPVTSAGADATIISGNSCTLNGSATGGITPYTYLWSPATGLNDPTLPDPVASPVTTITYTLSVTDHYGCSSTDDVTITVFPAGSVTLQGVITYDNTMSTPLSMVTVQLKQTGTTMYSTTTDLTGNYQFTGVAPGDYQLRCISSTPWGGVNSADALLDLKHFVGIIHLEGLRLIAGNVDNSTYINSIDALMIAKRFTGIISSFPAGDWAFTSYTLNLPYGGMITQDIKGLCYGEVNGSYLPPYKTAPALTLIREGTLVCNSDRTIELPFSLVSRVPAGALSLVMDYPYGAIDITGIHFTHHPENVVYNVINDHIRISWYTLDAYDPSADEPLFTLLAKVQQPFDAYLFHALEESELADPEGNLIPDMSLKYPSLSVAGDLDGISVNLQPNPFSEFAWLHLFLDKQQDLSYRIYDNAGLLVSESNEGVLDAGDHDLTISGKQLSEGSYFCVLDFTSDGILIQKHLKMIVIK
ncbi:MAG: hypothetical protein NTU44_13895 [Bacteroidetes bacterium]|nr:hypothetical protein [Bacteroidota bacterium]